ncbi:MAG: hypothetical protein QXE50_08175 [Nitrososphaerota archaeon]
MRLSDVFPTDIPHDGISRDDYLGDYDRGPELEDVLEGIEDVLKDKGIAAKVEYKLVASYSVPESLIERLGIDESYLYDPDGYTDSIYRIKIVSEDEKVQIYYVPDLHELGYFFGTLDDAKRAAEREIENLSLYLEWWYSG